MFIIVACVGLSFLTIYWDRQQFYLWQGFAAAGEAMVVIPLLMLSTNTVQAKEEAPWASSMINFPRSIAEVVAVWILDLVQQWRGALHYNRLVDQVGQDRWRLIEGPGVLVQYPLPLMADGRQGFSGAMSDFIDAIRRQASILTISDAFLIFAVLTAIMAFVVMVLPVRSLPPRLESKEL